MLDKLILKIKQMHKSLTDCKDNDLSKIEAVSGENQHFNFVKMDFSQGKTGVDIANYASLLIHNIASLKDHLKKYCTKNSISFDVENLINTDTDVAIIHDLWNIDKHFELDRPPRSGHTPEIKDLKQTMQLTAGKNSSVFMTVDKSGKLVQNVKGIGSGQLVITGSVIDENGNALGDFIEICQRAVNSWEQAFKQVGILIPK